MSTPPPPPPGQGPPPPPPPPPFPPQGYSTQGYPAQGYPTQGYGLPPVQQKTNGLSIASFVLSLATLIPCFWLLPLTAVLGIIFGFTSRGQLKRNPGQRGSGLSTAGIIIGFVFLAAAIAFWIWVATSGNCYRDGNTFRCEAFDS